MTSATTIDWPVAERLAERLGMRTRELVADRDPEAVRAWALRMASECGRDEYGSNGPRAASYAELAALVTEPEPTLNDQTPVDQEDADDN